ncbi:MAG: hypothetical protein KY445_08130 [Armatimonadetes bacterium]|nr:hypothetical protein [Armatimonadota bacterium]
MCFPILNEQQIEDFLQNGLITLHGSFEPSAAREWIEASGQAGDVILMHSFILHTASQNVRGKARIISNRRFISRSR